MIKIEHPSFQILCGTFLFISDVKNLHHVTNKHADKTRTTHVNSAGNYIMSFYHLGELTF